MMMERRHVASPMGGLFLIGLGVMFLLGQFLSFNIWHYMWPFLIVGLGLSFFGGMVLGGREGSTGGLAIPGSLFVMLGLIFFFQTITNHWASWAYAWALLAPTSTGIGLMIFGWWNRRPNLYQPGLILVTIGTGLFVVLGGFFELLLGIAGFATPGRILWPVLLITFGIYLLVSRGFCWTRHVYPTAMDARFTAHEPAGESKPDETSTVA
jgi:hypothetical protein